MIKEIGRRIITGEMNLTKVSFPIKAMVPRTALETATFSSSNAFECRLYVPALHGARSRSLIARRQAQVRTSWRGFAKLLHEHVPEAGTLGA